VTAHRHVLVIDDEADLRDVIQMSLELAGSWSVSTAASGRVGIDVARREHPDAILLDMMMPEMDGPETLARLRDDPETAAIPVVFLTAKVQASGVDVTPPGAAGLIRKPFDPLTLADELAALLGWEA
jgi:CheY-like chemotaxis protein